MPVAAGMAMNMVPPGMGMFPMYGMPAAMGGAMPAPAEGREPGRGGRGRHGSRPDTDAGPSSTRGAADGERDAEGTEHAAGDGDAAADGGRSGSDTERDAAARAPGAPRHAAAGPPRPPAAPAGGRAGRSQRTPTAYITVINIPPENLSIQHISEHFSKFGTIVNVEVRRRERLAPQLAGGRPGLLMVRFFCRARHAAPGAEPDQPQGPHGAAALLEPPRGDAGTAVGRSHLWKSVGAIIWQLAQTN